MDKYYQSYGIFRPKNQPSHDLLSRLYEIPEKLKGKNKPKFKDVDVGSVHQADLLYLPEDRDGSKYCLVVTDIGSRITDAEPLKEKSASAVAKAFEKIYSRAILSFPTTMIQTDPGTEFRGDVKKLFDKEHVIMRYAKTDRHQQQAMVEAKNRIIGKAVFFAQHTRELHTDKPDTNWVDDLPHIIRFLNEKLERPEKESNRIPAPKCQGDACILLEVGTKVRVALDAPRELVGDTKLHGRFRATDIRWERQPTTITQQILSPGQPPLYLTAKYPHTPYAKQYLQVVDENESLPPNIPLPARPTAPAPAPAPPVQQTVQPSISRTGRVRRPNPRYAE